MNVTLEKNDTAITLKSQENNEMIVNTNINENDKEKITETNPVILTEEKIGINTTDTDFRDEVEQPEIVDCNTIQETLNTEISLDEIFFMNRSQGEEETNNITKKSIDENKETLAVDKDEVSETDPLKETVEEILEIKDDIKDNINKSDKDQSEIIIEETELITTKTIDEKQIKENVEEDENLIKQVKIIEESDEEDYNDEDESNEIEEIESEDKLKTDSATIIIDNDDEDDEEGEEEDDDDEEIEEDEDDDNDEEEEDEEDDDDEEEEDVEYMEESEDEEVIKKASSSKSISDEFSSPESEQNYNKLNKWKRKFPNIKSGRLNPKLNLLNKLNTISRNTKINKRSRNWQLYLKKRSIKWLTKRMHVMETEEAIAECSAKSENNKINLLDNSVTIIETSSTITTTTATSTTTAISEETPKSPSQNVVIPVKEIKPVEVDIELQEEEDEDIVELISDSEKEKTKVVEENAEEKTKKEKSKNDEKPEEEKIKTIVLDIDIEENQAVDLTQENNRKTNREIENIIKNISDATNAENINKKQINEKTSIKNKETSSKEITTDPLILSIRASEKTNQIIKIEPSSSPDSVVCSKQTDEETPKTVNVSGATKRPLSPQSLDYTNPTKKHCDEIVTNFDSQNKILSEYLEKTSNESPDELKKHILHIEEEIHTLDDLLKTKEQEWNNMLHLKKMKEEILERLTRKKRINDIRSILIGPEDYRKKSTPTTTQSTITATVKDYSHGAGNLSNNSVSSVCSNSSTLNPTTAQSILHCRANMKSADLVKEKLNTARLQRNILPKTSHCSNQKFLNFSTINSQQQQQTKKNLNDFLNGHQTPMGRQGAIKDVQSIIADFRQKHPEAVPRRGRRLRPSFSINDLSTSQRKSTENRMSELGILLTNVEGVESRPSSADSSHSNSNSVSTNNNNNNNMTPVSNAVSFKDVLVKFAKMTPSERQMLNTGNSSNLLSTLNNSNNSIGGPVVKPPPPYPEVTLHPLNSHSDQNSSAQTSSHTNSLLHGILTKQSTGRPANVYNSFSPTLARLLTAPERINPQASKHYHTQSQQSSVAAGVNLTKNHNEITITPVVNNQSIQQTLYQQQKQDNANLHNRMKSETFNLISADEEADDSVDRLVIDEGDSASDHQNISLSATGQEFHENEVPECQGCKKREAQFVCAGCGNQWYCSRDCQVMAWDEHSEICTG